MNLIIDVGNSFVKLAVFENNNLIFKEIVELDSILEEILNIKSRYKNLSNGIIASVGNLDNTQLDFIKDLFNLFILNANTKLPFINLYKTPNTLGIDRIALICASVNKYPNRNTLVIDAGTCITYDFVSKENEYFGGAISPGLKMRYKSLHNFTQNLPLLSLEYPKSVIGNSTAECIHSGVVNGVLNEIKGIISTYEEKYLDLTVILTGGDSNFLSKQLKSSIFANSNFLLEGLNFILQFNSNE